MSEKLPPESTEPEAISPRSAPEILPPEAKPEAAPDATPHAPEAPIIIEGVKVEKKRETTLADLKASIEAEPVVVGAGETAVVAAATASTETATLVRVPATIPVAKEKAAKEKTDEKSVASGFWGKGVGKGLKIIAGFFGMGFSMIFVGGGAMIRDFAENVSKMKFGGGGGGGHSAPKKSSGGGGGGGHGGGGGGHGGGGHH